MSPFSHLLQEIRVRHSLRQADLAKRIGYEQSYISALEVGLKGPPTDEFLDRLAAAVPLTQAEQDDLRAAAQASKRKLVIDPDAPSDIFWLLSDLRDEIQHLTPVQVRMIRDVLALRCAMGALREPTRRVKRRRNQEAIM